LLLIWVTFNYLKKTPFQIHVNGYVINRITYCPFLAWSRCSPWYSGSSWCRHFLSLFCLL